MFIKFLYLNSGESLVDSPDAFGMSPLMIASQKGYTRLGQDCMIFPDKQSFPKPS